MYAEPVELWNALNLDKQVYEEDVGAIDGTTTFELNNNNLIENTVTLYIDGSEVSKDDYIVSLDKGEIAYTGTDSGDGTVDYQFAPISNSDVTDALKSATDFVDNYTNTTFDSTENRTVYVEGQGKDKQYILLKQPVQTINSIIYYDDAQGEVTLTQGKDEDYIVHGNGFLITNDTYKTSELNDRLQFKVDYNYGFNTIPDSIKRATIYLAAQEYLRLNITSKNIQGRDNFDPETSRVLNGDATKLMDQYRADHMGLVANELET